MEYKILSKCKVEKAFSEFNRNSSTKDNLQHSCELCDRMKTSQWFENNREKCNCYKKNYIKKRRANDEFFRFADTLRSRLYQALIKQVTRNNTKTEELLGISIEEFEKYIEFLSSPEMNWKNIDLDHVHPLSSFNQADPNQLKEASHFSNIQPLLKQDNRKKGSRYHEHDLAVQKEKVYDYECYKYYSNF